MQDLGLVTAYAYAKSTGEIPDDMTPEQFAELLASYTTVAQEAAVSAEAAEGSATSAAASASQAGIAATNAAGSESASASSASQAQIAAGAAAQSRTDAAASATAAAGSAFQASSSASGAASSASAASTSASDANAAKTAAVTAQGAAETAQGKAEDAQGAAEDAQTAAEAAAQGVQSGLDQIAQNTSDIGDLQTAMESKAEIDGEYESMTVGNAEQLVATVGVDEASPYLFRTTGGSADVGDRMELRKVVGGTVAWNQLVTDPDFEDGRKWVPIATNYQTISVADNMITVTTIGSTGSNGIANNASVVPKLEGHKILFSVFIKPDKNCYIRFGGPTAAAGNYNLNSIPVSAGVWNHVEAIGNVASGNTVGRLNLYLDTSRNLAEGDAVQVKKFIAIDLTACFDSDIADYLYSLDTTTRGAGASTLKSWGFLQKDYYPYNAGELISTKFSAHEEVGFNAYDHDSGTAEVVGGNVYQITGTYTAISLDGTAITPASGGYFTPDHSGTLTVTGGSAYDTCVHLKWDGERDGEYESYVKHTYPLDDSLTLRGIPKKDSAGNLYYDGDEYLPDGTVNRRYGIVDLGTLNWIYRTDTTNPIFQALLNVLAKKGSAIIVGNFVCSKYISVTSNAVSLEGGDKGIAVSAGGDRVYLQDSAYTDVTTFKQYLTDVGAQLVYEVATPTTESAEPYQETQICDDFGTEAFIVPEQSGLSLPVGNESYYQANLRAKLEMAPDSPDGDGDYLVRQTNGQNEYVQYVSPIPAVPTTDGTYVLKCTVTSGAATLSWEAEA